MRKYYLLPEEYSIVEGHYYLLGKPIIFGFAMKSTLLHDSQVTPIAVIERLMTSCIPLLINFFANFFSACAQTLVSEKDVRDSFYKKLLKSEKYC